MSLLKIIGTTLIEALFPLSTAERELFALSPERAVAELSPAPPFTGLAVPLPEARSVFAYKDVRAEQLVWNIKYKKSPVAVRIGGYALWRMLIGEGEHEEIKGSCEPSHVVLIPTPITARRRRERGFNQCELLVDEITRLHAEREARKEKELPNISLTVDTNLLFRIHHASRQTLKGRGERVESAKGIFSVDGEAAKKYLRDTAGSERNISLIVIDDVITTGSTMREALDVLKKAGFKDVRGLSLAH